MVRSPPNRVNLWGVVQKCCIWGQIISPKSHQRWLGNVATGVVTGVAGGGSVYPLAVRESGEVVVFGAGGTEEVEDEEGDELDEPVFVVDGRLGLGAEVGVALLPTVVPGIHTTMAAGQ